MRHETHRIVYKEIITIHINLRFSPKGFIA